MSRFSAANFKKQTHTATIDIDGEPLVVSFRSFSLAEYARLKTNSTGPDGELAVAEFLADILISWELPTSQEDPTPYPTTLESLVELPVDFITRLLIGIGESRQQGK